MDNWNSGKDLTPEDISYQELGDGTLWQAGLGFIQVFMKPKPKFILGIGATKAEAKQSLFKALREQLDKAERSLTDNEFAQHVHRRFYTFPDGTLVTTKELHTYKHG